MTKDKALYQYFNGFKADMAFYPSTSVIKDAVFPFGTYDIGDASFNDPEIVGIINLYYYTTGEAGPNQGAREFRDYIEENPYIICDEGVIWIKPGAPWCKSLVDESDNAIKRRYINIQLDFETT